MTKKIATGESQRFQCPPCPPPPAGADGASTAPAPPLTDRLDGAADAPAPATEKSGRDARGRFAKGNAGGPGRQRRAVEIEYLRALSDAVSPDAWNRVCAVALRQALQGDDKARAFLAKYLLGECPPSLVTLAANELLAQPLGDCEVVNEAVHQSAEWFRLRWCCSEADEMRYDIAERSLQELRGEEVEPLEEFLAMQRYSRELRNTELTDEELMEEDGEEADGDE